MRKNTWISVILLVVFSIGVVKLQSSIIVERKARRMEEKILMLSNRPEVTKILALGHDSTVSDLLWIRAIQYFGGNFSTLDNTLKRDGMINLFRNMVALDTKFHAAYKFGGFVMNESMKDPELAIDFLLEGADENASQWRLRFDAGFIAFFQLKDYDFAKRLFIQTVYGENFSLSSQIKTEGLVDGFLGDALIDDDLITDVKFSPQTGSIVIDLEKPKQIGRIYLVQESQDKQTLRVSYANASKDEVKPSFTEFPQITASGIHPVTPAITAQFIRIDNMTTEAADGFFALNEIQMQGPRNVEVPSYVERMAYEMDRAAGRFRAAWNQYLRYFKEFTLKGDQINATLAKDKLDTIFTTTVTDILEETILLYKEKEGKLPTPKMQELVKGEYLHQIIRKKMQEEERFTEDVLPVLVGPNLNLYNMLTTWDNSSYYVLVTYPVEDGDDEWLITIHSGLEDMQKASIDALQKLVNQYKQEKGQFPKEVEDLKKGRLFTAPEAIFEDPLGGELIINQETGKIEAINSKY